MVEAMGGRLAVGDERGRRRVDVLGQLRRVDAPARRAQPTVAGSPQLAELAEAEGTVLCVEDHPANVELILDILAPATRIDVVTADTGAAGLEKARSLDLDLILLDVHLPDTNGFEVLRALRADPATASVSIVVVSADATPQKGAASHGGSRPLHREAHRSRRDGRRRSRRPDGARTKPGRPIPANRVTVYVAEDHPLFRKALIRRDQAAPGAGVRRVRGGGRQALEDIRTLLPDVLVLDMRLPDIDGQTVLNAITRDRLDTKVLVVSAHIESHVVYEALENGAAGFMSKLTDEHEVCDAIVTVARGDPVLPRELQTGVLEEIRARRDPGWPRLTDRELAVVRLLGGRAHGPGDRGRAADQRGHRPQPSPEPLRQAQGLHAGGGSGGRDARRPARVSRARRGSST